MGSCHYCKATAEEMRPYGPGGAELCYACMTATPEREAQARAAFSVQLEAAEVVGGGITVIGETAEHGPRPATEDEQEEFGDLLHPEKAP